MSSSHSRPEPLWTPPLERQQHSRLGQWLAALRQAGPLERVLNPGAGGGARSGGVEGYEAAWRWSVDRPEQFWPEVAKEVGLEWSTPPESTLVPGPDGVADARWWPGGRTSYARQALAGAGQPGDAVAVVAHSQTRKPVELTWDQLRSRVREVRAGLEAAGVGEGDRVAGYLPNIPEALVAFLATASLGAVWTCCASEMGVAGVLDRLAQVEPTVLIGADGYCYGDRRVDRSHEMEAIRQGLPTLRAAVWLSYLEPQRAAPGGWTAWDALSSHPGPGPEEPEHREVPSDHPLYILYSSGTTGRPKAIVHGHAGILFEHAKALAFQFDVAAGDRLFWFTTTGWMMWNFLVSGLVVGAAVVLFDGNPAWPDNDALWALIEDTETTVAGVGAASLVAAQKAGVEPAASHDLSRLRTLGSTGSPLPAATAQWVYDAVSPDLMLGSFSGGTDVCTGFVGPSPLHPVWAGEIACRCLGAAVEVFDDRGRSVVGEEGELVLTAPLPSMPVGFWGDGDRRRYHEAYFERFPGVWAHGDRMTLTHRGTCVITGRSDGTLNRGGVRMGTAEFYDVVEGFDEVADSLVVHVPDAEGGNGELWLFVVPADPSTPARDDLAARLKTAIRTDLSPRHVPDHVVTVPAVPRTLSGKKLEVPVKRILAGAAVEDALTLASVANPDSLDAIVAARRG
ncbi:acetoacetate--CoA ligase [Acidiferrimicrobium sp. IK]|uniref:acetoacetate--CoA ligase n=1 Tax=Acidiferrimicrobium sp. IK TaxID=2871700 RepID=UPI0021CB9348|nr:acetoacetate--CoA ligase [Acidiferrimicrobium sp. IK]MCU4184128.1 acetoacetate--CoA ligase [Acidiferrimicrobium sp. IK]